MKPLFLGLHGLTLSAAERAFFTAVRPAGYILFKRNIADPEQVRALTDDLRALSGREDLPILIDQEGGRVARLGPPHWPAFPPGRAFDALYEIAPISAIEAVRHNARALGLMLGALGITVDCLPLLDVPVPGAHDIIGDRALGLEPMRVAALGKATLEGLAMGGVVGVVKHIPGHGRAASDSHVELPVVTAGIDELAIDFEPFAKLKDAPMAMTAHVIYTAIDPDRCASVSPVVINDIIRGRIGFDGLLMSDDLGMHALQGSFADRARGVIDAGCDIALHCSGNMAEMEEVASAVPPMSPKVHDRLERAMASVARDAKGDFADAFADAIEKRDVLLALADQPDFA